MKPTPFNLPLFIILLGIISGIIFQDISAVLSIKNSIFICVISISVLFFSFYIIKKFTEVVSKLGRDNFEMVHLQNAAGIYNYDVDVVTHIRTGMLTYGLQEAGFYDHDLKPVFTGLIGYVDSVRYVSELDYVAYEDLSSISPKTKKIAKIKIGYGDGFPKANNKTTCLIKKKEYVISQVTMDNTFIEVDDRINAGDKVHLYHRPNEMKMRTGLSMLEALIAISPLRVKRIFEGEEN